MWDNFCLHCISIYYVNIQVNVILSDFLNILMLCNVQGHKAKLFMYFFRSTTSKWMLRFNMLKI